jgi:hypothetical protein
MPKDARTLERAVHRTADHADLLSRGRHGFLLDREKKPLSHYSDDLRRESYSELTDSPDEPL